MNFRKLALMLTGAATLAGLSWTAQAADPIRLGFIEPFVITSYSIHYTKLYDT